MSETQRSQDAVVAVATLEMQTGHSPCGTLISCDGRRTSFSGWVEFASVIEDWRARSDQSTRRERAQRATA